jgi:hypothetical protein
MKLSADILAQIQSQFDPHHHERIASLLQRYGADDSHREVDRVHAAILHLADGDPDRIADLVQSAITDYRDVLYWLTFDEHGNPPPLRPFINAPITATPPDISPDHRQRDQELLVIEPPEYRSVTTAVNPLPRQIEDLMKQMSWKDVSFVLLRIDERHWLEVSGSTKTEDGYSARCCIAGKEYVASRAPKSLSELVTLLSSFRAGDGRWRTLIDWS